MEFNALLKKFEDMLKQERVSIFDLEDEFNALSASEKRKIFPILIKNSEFDEQKLSCLLRVMYPEPYRRDEEIDETPNIQTIRFLSELLNDASLQKRFLNDFSLLACLDPHNRSKVYASLYYSYLSKDEKKILIKLLTNQVEIKLQNCILDDEEFIADVASIADPQEYNKAFRTIQLNRPNKLDKITQKRQEVVDGLIDEYMLDSKNFFEHYDSKYVRNFVELVFERFFSACVNDTFLTANVILDASKSLFELENEMGKTLSENGRAVLEELREILISLMKENNTPSHFKNNVGVDEEFEEHFKNIINNARKIQNFPSKYANLYKLARKVFENRVNIEISKLPLQPKSQKGNPNIFEIDYTKPFHMLVHVQEIDDMEDPKQIARAITPALPTYEHRFDVSMSLINNSHFNMFKTNSFGEEIVFGLSHLPEGSLTHAFMGDSFTQYTNKHMRAPRFAEIITNYPPTYLDIDSFMSGTKNFNEIKVHATATAKDEKGQNIMLPSYILCVDRIDAKHISVAEQLGIPIVFVDTKKLDPTINLNNGNHTSLTMKYHDITNTTFTDRKNPLLI